MKAKLKLSLYVFCFLLLGIGTFVPSTSAYEVTVKLEDINSADTEPPGNFRWLDVANQPFRQFIRENYDYTQADVTVTYEIVAGTLQGTLTAFKLKPNFAYQLKLAGNPDLDADSNERIGLAGRWWQEYNGTGKNLNSKGDGSSPNPNDDIYFDTWDDPAYRYTGYLVFDYFITDEYGDATFSFEANSSYHVLWATNDSDGNDGVGHDVQEIVDGVILDGPLKESIFDADLSTVVLSDEEVPAYDGTSEDDDFLPQTVAIFGEWERLPVGGVFPEIGDNFFAQLILTEESFHENIFDIVNERYRFNGDFSS